ncbi:MAG: hypothetical protein KZQ93_14295 [Candidatus Thiodiazotropha sp. (ex Monitilora ramsayi)]|nr:hypothetical protein [Candidatus Thiodiazotropha sp. (ex Monitilora ramsayi)]
MGRLAVLILALYWIHPAEAFFCFTFGTHGGAGKQIKNHRWMPYRLPPPVTYNLPTFNPEPESNPPLPAIRPEKSEPEIIQGYRFRPLVRREGRIPPSVPQTDWQH